MGRRDAALRIHVHDGSGAAAGAPRDKVGVGFESERALSLTGQSHGIGGLALDARKVKAVAAGASGIFGNLSVSPHFCRERGKSC